ncbi:excisionase family protein, partial [Salmonella enterica subsp. enterica serovar Montevideo]|nr:excisionase family protein [Salmonella enterica subsp. enterica serovar Montevideo]
MRCKNPCFTTCGFSLRLRFLIAVTGLKPGTITRARKESWMLGREYLHISPDGNPKPSSEC